MKEYIVPVGDKGNMNMIENELHLQQLIRCEDCDNKECWGRAGDVVCGIDGTPHKPDWFCADGVRR